MLKSELIARNVELTASELAQRVRAEKAEAKLAKCLHLLDQYESEAAFDDTPCAPLPTPKPRATWSTKGQRIRAWLAKHPRSGTTHVEKADDGAEWLCLKSGVRVLQLTAPR